MDSNVNALMSRQRYGAFRATTNKQNMKNILAIVILIGAFTSCEYKSGSGDIVKRTRSLQPFKRVSASGGVTVEIVQGNTQQVVVEADDNIMEDVETIVDNGQLRISMEDGINYSDMHVKVFITTQELTEISGSASADITVVNVLQSSSKIELEASSGSSIKALVDAPQATAEASSGAEIDVTGKTKTLKVKASSGASVDAFELLSEDTYADASSGGTVNTHASVKLDAKASSGGSVSYRGPATTVAKESSGGSITKQN